MSTRQYFYSDTGPGSEPIVVGSETVEKTPHTFQPNGNLWELESIRHFYKHVPVDRAVNVIDIGAQSGLYTLYAKFRPNAHFYAFEPFPETYALLEQNIALNHLENVTCQRIGISEHSGSAVLNTCRSHNGLHTMGGLPSRFSDILPVPIETRTLDSLFFDEGIPIDFLKIDTEGSEFAILKGGERSIMKYRPYIQIEWNAQNMQQCGVDSEDFGNYIRKTLRYETETLINEELFLVPKILKK